MIKKENKEKRVPKTTPKLNVDLSEEQKKVAEAFYQYDVTFVVSDFGTGKTLSAVHTALMHLRKRNCNNIWIARPMLKNLLGALKGTLEEKLAPYTYPIQQNIEVCQGKAATDKMLKDGIIKIMPIEVAKGVTFMDSVVVIDEAEDMDYIDFRTILTRLGEGSKMIFCCSEEQIDRQMKDRSCMPDILRLENSGLVGFVRLTENRRNPVLTKIINFLEGK